jgi:signal transduction histidine kinase
VARCLLKEGLRDYLPAEALDTLGLLSSELVANAVAASPDDCVISVTVPEPAVIRVSVADTGPLQPEQHPLTATAESGRGLQIVAGLALRSGTEPATVGKTVWFEVATSGVV